MDTKSFIERASLVHDNKYDYSKINYKNTVTKVEIICHKHGPFHQAPKHHLRGSGCPKCSGNIQTFFEKASFLHKNRYDYNKSHYINCKTNLEIICKDHGSFWQSPSNHLKGRGCPKCCFISDEQFIDDAIEIHGKSKYDYSKVNCKSKTSNVIIICKKHGSFTTNYISHINRKIGCKQCDNEEQIKILISKFIILYGLKYDYNKIDSSNTRDKITITCKKHGDFVKSIANHLKGQGCPSCSKESRLLSFDEFINRANKKHNNKYSYKTYCGLNNKSQIVCPIHGNFEQIANNHLKGLGCPKCSNNLPLTTEEFINRANIIHNNKYDYSKTKYVNYKKHITITCSTHGDFIQSPKVHLIGCGCQKCGLSTFHKEVYEYVKSIYDKNIEINDRNTINPKEIDIYLNDLKFGIECHGEWWHQNDKIRHREKAITSHSKNINLFQIFHNEWQNKQKILKSMISNKLNLSQRIYARKCHISTISNIEYKQFTTANHLQGNISTSIKYGLYYNNVLVAILGIRKHKKYQYEIARYACKSFTNVIGGFSKLLKKFINDYNPGMIMTFADARFSSGGLYLKNGFSKIEMTRPNYFYYKQGIVLSRQKCQKHKLHKLLPQFNDKKTEYENMLSNGYCKVYDAGHYKLIWTK